MEIPEHLGQLWKQDAANRLFLKTEEDLPQSKTFANGVEFLDINHQADNWFLHVETFDPHEPFFTTPEYQELYELNYEGALFDWPFYRPVTEEEKPYVDHLRNMYAALVTMCDRNLGRILDKMDEYDLWRDTMLIVNTDHGFFVGERGWFGKSNPVNLLDEVSHTPLFIYDPRSKAMGRTNSLVQNIDLAPTVLEYFGVDIPKDMLGKPLKDVIAQGMPEKPCESAGKNHVQVHEACIYGTHGGQIACTNGRYVHILAPQNPDAPLYNYTLMPTHMRCMYPVEELQDVSLAEPFSFTKGCRLMRTSGYNLVGEKEEWTTYETLLFDLETDPMQEHPFRDEALEEYFKKEIVRIMKENDAPQELYLRMGLE